MLCRHCDEADNSGSSDHWSAVLSSSVGQVKSVMLIQVARSRWCQHWMPALSRCDGNPCGDSRVRLLPGVSRSAMIGFARRQEAAWSGGTEPTEKDINNLRKVREPMKKWHVNQLEAKWYEKNIGASLRVRHRLMPGCQHLAVADFSR